jgi:microcystin-dependent protein
MATTYVDYPPATSGQTEFEFTFPYLEDEHVKVEINGVATTAFTISTTPTQKVILDAPGATAGDQVRVRRRSAPNQNLVDFVNGSVLTESELDLAYRHNRYLAEEIAELNDQSLQVEAGGTEWDAKNLRIQNVGTPTATTDAVTKIYLDNKVAQVSSGATQPPLKWQFPGLAGANGTYTVTGAEVQGDTAYEVSIDGLIQEPGVDFTVNPNTDTLTIVPTLSGGEDIVVIQRGFGVAVAGTVGTNSLLDGSVTNAKLAAGAVTSDKISTTDTKFNVQSDGKVGIGTASPSKGIEIINKQGILIRESQGSLGNQMPLISSSIADRLDQTDWGIALKAVVEDELANGFGIAFWTRNAFNGTFSEKVRISKVGEVGIGTATPAHALDVVGDINITGDYKVNGTNLTTVPTGTVSAFAGSAAPTGYLLCDGTAVNRTTYATLFGVISTTYGTGDGSTTFNLPDLRGRVVAGLGESLLGATPDTLGENNGLIASTKTHTLTTSELPSHQHTTDGTNSGDIHAVRKGSDGIIDGLSSSATNDDAYYKTGSVTGTAGSGQAHNNVQPTIILNYIIKI